MCNLSYGISEIAMQKGLEEGLQKGIEKGMEKGLQKGKKEERMQIIQNMLLKHLPKSDIKELVNATDEEIAEAEEALCTK